MTDINADKFHKQNVTTVSTTQSTGTTTTVSGASESKKPIDFSSQQTDVDQQKNKEILEYINSDEFKNLSEEQQIKQFKAKFFPTSDDETVKGFLNTAKQAVVQLEGNDSESEGVKSSDSQSTDSTEKAETVAQEGQKNGETPAVESADSSSVKNVEVKAEGESVQVSSNEEFAQLADKYVEKTGFEGTIDDLISDLKTKQLTGEDLSPEQQAILDKFEANEASKNESSVMPKMKKEDVAKAYIDIAMDPSLTKEQKLSKIANNYFQNDENYQKLDDEQKAEYVKEHVSEIYEKLHPNDKDKSFSDYVDVALVFAHAQLEGKTPKELSELDSKQLKDIVKDTKTALVGDIFNQIKNSPKLKDKSFDEKLDMMTDMFLSLSHDGYTGMEEAQKSALKAEMLDKIKSGVSSITGNDWTHMDDNQKEIVVNVGLDIYRQIVNNEQNISDFFDPKNYKTSLQVMTAVLGSEKYQNNTACKTLKFKVDTMLKYGINPNEQTNLDLYNTLKKNYANLTKEEKEYYEQLDAQVKAGNKDFLNQRAGHALESNDARATVTGKTKEENLTNDLRQANGDKKLIQAAIDRFIRGEEEDLLNNSNRKIDFDALKNQIMKELKCTEAEAEEYIRNAKYNNFTGMVEGNRIGNADLVSMSITMGSKYASKAQNERGAEFISNGGLNSFHKDSKALSVIGIATENSDAYRDSFRGLIADRKYITSDVAINTAKNIASSDKLTSAQKTDFATKTVEKFSINGQQELKDLYTSLTTIKNADVDKGLAAAIYTVSPDSRNEVYSLITNNFSNYSQIQKDSIETAKNTSLNSHSYNSNIGGNPQRTTSNNNNRAASSSVSASSNNNSSNSSSQAANFPARTSSSYASSSASARTVSSNSSVSSSASASASASSQVTPAQIDSFARSLEASTAQSKTSQDSHSEAAESSKKAEVKTQASTTQASSQTQSREEKYENQIEEQVVQQVHGVQLTDQQLEEFKSIMRSGGIQALYDRLMQTIGSDVQNTFFSILVQHAENSTLIDFASNNPSAITRLLEYCDASSVRFDLMKLLSQSQIKELVNNQKVDPSDFEKLVKNGNVDSATIVSFLTRNKSLLSIDDLKRYSQYLSYEDQVELDALINEKLGQQKGSDAWNYAQNQSMRGRNYTGEGAAVSSNISARNYARTKGKPFDFFG